MNVYEYNYSFGCWLLVCRCWFVVVVVEPLVVEPLVVEPLCPDAFPLAQPGSVDKQTHTPLLLGLSAPR